MAEEYLPTIKIYPVTHLCCHLFRLRKGTRHTCLYQVRQRLIAILPGRQPKNLTEQEGELQLLIVWSCLMPAGYPFPSFANRFLAEGHCEEVLRWSEDKECCPNSDCRVSCEPAESGPPLKKDLQKYEIPCAVEH